MTAAERGPLRVVGRYAVYNEIAAGGMATVHIGRLLGPVGFARTVAVKRLHPQFAKDPEFVSMFLDEARLAARVQHPNVVATIDVVATDGELFLIMDYVRGESLSKLVRTVKKQGGRMPPRIAASICCGFLHGLHAAHEAKNERGDRIDLVHRDVSPQNVLVGADGIARVLDFGIAKAAGRVQVTRDGQIKGKLAYMPPEQLSGRELTRAVDIYAGAVVIWETLTGERLFKGETESETLAKILRDDVLPPSEVVPGLGTVFDAPILRALSRDPKQRHATARELAFELEKCVGVASASEVGEWVENMVGSILSAREDQIAEIESNSSNLRISDSGRPEPDTDSDSDAMNVPSALASTLLGIGAPSSGSKAKESERRRAPPTPTAPMSPMVVDALRAQASDESTGSRITGSLLTGTLSLPVDKRLPILACAVGLLVLLVIVGVVVAHRPEAAQTPALASSVSSVSSAPESSSATLASAAPMPAIPDPEPAASAVASAPPAPSAPASSAAAPSEAATTVSAPHPTSVRPAPPVAPVRPPVVTTPRKDCNPNYTVDPATGRKKYKLECM